MNEGLPLLEPAQADQKVWCQKIPMDRPIKVPSWWGNNWLYGFSCSHRAPAHGELLTLLKMTDFPFWISESRTPISEPVKLFFLHLDAILMTQHSTLPGTGGRKRSLIWYYFGRGVCKFTILNTHGWHSSFTQVVCTLFPKLRAFVESDVTCSYETFLRKK